MTNDEIKKLLRRSIACSVLAAFFINSVVSPAGAQVLPVLNNPGSLVSRLATDGLGIPSDVTSSVTFQPPVLLGLKIHPENPLLFDFIVDQGQSKLSTDELKEETTKLVKYFLAALTIPDKEVWVNLSPTEKDRIIPDVLGQTTMGKTMLEQDYVLKQLASSLTNPETELGKKYWANVGNRHACSLQNKVWIMPAKAEVLESNGIVLVGEKRLKVMLAEEMIRTLEGGRWTLEKNNSTNDQRPASSHQTHQPPASSLQSNIFRTTILPTIEQAVNEGKEFADVRQIYNSVILAAWYKKALKESLLGKVYTDKSKVAGVETDDKAMKQRIYEQYLAAFKKGAYNLIKEEADENGELIPRKYFSGGAALNASSVLVTKDGPVAEREIERTLSGSSQIVNARTQLATTLVETEVVSSAAVQLAQQPNVTASSGLVESKEFQAALDLQVDKLIIALANDDERQDFPSEIRNYFSQLIIKVLYGENLWGEVGENFYESEYEQQLEKSAPTLGLDNPLFTRGRAMTEYWNEFSGDGIYRTLKYNQDPFIQNLLKRIFLDHIFYQDPTRDMELFPTATDISGNPMKNYTSVIRQLGLSIQLNLSEKARQEDRAIMLKARPEFVTALTEAVASMRKMHAQLKNRRWIFNLEVRRLALAILSSRNSQSTLESFDTLAQTISALVGMQGATNQISVEKLNSYIESNADNAFEFTGMVAGAFNRLNQVLPYAQGGFLQNDWVEFWHSVMVRVDIISTERDALNISLEILAIDLAENMLMEPGVDSDLNAVAIELDNFAQKYEKQLARISEYPDLVAAINSNEFPRLGPKLRNIFERIYADRSESLDQAKVDFLNFIGLFEGYLRAPFSSVDETVKEQTAIVLRKLNNPHLQYGQLIISELLKEMDTPKTALSWTFFHSESDNTFLHIHPDTLDTTLVRLGIILGDDYTYSLEEPLEEALAPAIAAVQTAIETQGYVAGGVREGFLWTDQKLINIDLAYPVKKMIKGSASPNDQTKFAVIDSEQIIQIGQDVTLRDLIQDMFLTQRQLGSKHVVFSSWKGDLYYLTRFGHGKANLSREISKQNFRAIGQKVGEGLADYYRRMRAESISSGSDVNVLGIIEGELVIFQGGIDIVVASSASAVSEKNQDSTVEWNKGGIDFDPTNMNLQIKRDGKGVPLPLPQQNLEQINIEGLFPVIINITPINAQTLPIFLGQVPKEPAKEPELAALTES